MPATIPPDDPFARPEKALRAEDRFVAEGRWAVEAAIDGGYPIKCALVVEGADPHLVEKVARACAGSGGVFRRERRTTVSETVGYPFHRGVVAVFRRPEGSDFADWVARCGRTPRRIVVFAAGLADASNLGAIIRCAAALGASAVVAGGGGTSPYARKAIRASAGAVFRVPVFEPEAALEAWRALPAGWERVATAVGGGAVTLDDFGPSRSHLAVAFGEEGAGLGDDWLAASDRRVTVPMAGGMDSLNVACTAAIVLHQLRNPGRA